MSARQKRTHAKGFAEFTAHDVQSKAGQLFVVCPCGARSDLGMYGAAQHGAGHTLNGQCDQCKRVLVIYGQRKSK